MDNSAAIAAIRFGLGRTPGQGVGTDPQRWLSQQLSVADPGPAAASVTDSFTALLFDQRARGDTKAEAVAGAVAARGEASQARGLFRADTMALLDQAVSTATPFRERLVWFWANHFTVSIRKGQIAPLIGDYVRSAIRPHVTGRFTDMLLAVMRHPAMLLYLDNAISAGPRSVFGGRQNRGLNENLARECLELHTVGGGYSQADVTEFARILTGWSVERQQNPLGYRFRPGLAEPGDKMLMGRSYPEGEEGGLLALQMLGTHPATYRHLATKLVQHFVGDLPPADAVGRVAAVLRDTGGNLGAAALEVTRLPGAWQPLTKLRTPQDYVVATFRAAGLPADKRQNMMQLVGGLGQAMFNAPLPNGWVDQASEWAGPEALLRRVDWAYGFANRQDLPEPMELAETALGPLLSASTAAEVRRAGSRRDAITLLLASPEMQRR